MADGAPRKFYRNGWKLFSCGAHKHIVFSPLRSPMLPQSTERFTPFAAREWRFFCATIRFCL
jgi:hypothetical protein